ncbi:MAG: TonB-dependent receptor family protein [Ramlibacter sp.]
MQRTLATSAVLACLPALAQLAPAGPASQTTLQPVVVTAMPGVAQSAFDTPVSIDVIGDTQLRDAQLGVNLSESLARAPGITALNRQNYAQDIQISSRGYGARSTFGARGLRLYTDGIPATAADGQGQVSHFDLNSADRIEVLRGPFSALYGNSSGGVISLFTADGGPRTVAEVSSAVASFGTQRHAVRLSGQQGAVQYNLSATRFDTDGARAHSAATREGFNGKVKYTASEATKVTVILNSVRLPDAQDPMGLTRAEYDADPRQASPAALQFDTRKSVQQTQGGVVVDHRLDAVHAVKFTGWSGTRETVQFQSIPVATQAPITHPGGVIGLDRRYAGFDAQWTARLRMLDHPFTVTAGLTTDRLDEQRRGWQNFTGTGAGQVLGVQGALRRDEDNRLRSLDEYLQGVWTSGRVSVTAGLRHSDIRFDSDDHFIAGANGNDSGSTRFEATTPALGVVFHATDAINLYASSGRGFETPTFNELSYRPGGPGLNFGLRSATSRQWELGAKAELDKRWTVNAALFEARTADEIVVLSNVGGRSTFQNAGRTLRRGVEAALAGRWGEGWSTQVAATLMEATYRNGFLTCGAPPCTVPTLAVNAGNRMPGIPRAMLFAELAWQHRPTGLGLAAELRHTGSIAVDDRNTDAAPASTVLALRATLQQAVGRWTVREFARVDNVGDRRYAGSVIVNEGNGRYFEPAPGRNWLVGLNAAYTF